jgi:hypothetical protein
LRSPALSRASARCPGAVPAWRCHPGPVRGADQGGRATVAQGKSYSSPAACRVCALACCTALTLACSFASGVCFLDTLHAMVLARGLRPLDQAAPSRRCPASVARAASPEHRRRSEESRLIQIEGQPDRNRSGDGHTGGCPRTSGALRRAHRRGRATGQAGPGRQTARMVALVQRGAAPGAVLP